MIETELIGVLGLVGLFTLLLLGVPVGLSMVCIGIVGNYALSYAVPYLRFEPYLMQFVARKKNYQDLQKKFQIYPFQYMNYDS